MGVQLDYIKWPFDYAAMVKGHPETFTYLEIKSDLKPVKYTADQKKHIADGWPVVTVRTLFERVGLRPEPRRDQSWLTELVSRPAALGDRLGT